MRLSPRTLWWLTLAELEVSRRVLEASRKMLTPEMCNRLLADQGVYLGWLYAALAQQIGTNRALGEFARLLAR
jgi:hypothetical protein